MAEENERQRALDRLRDRDIELREAGKYAEAERLQRQMLQVHVLSWTHEGRRWLNESNLADCATSVNSYILLALISRPRRWLCRKIGVLLVFVLLLLIASFGCTYVDTRCFPRRGTSNESIRYAGRWNERLRKWTSDTQILLTHKDTRRPGVEIESHGESSHDFVESHILNSKKPQDHSH